jgi:membrane-associated phospholipid phosphatase
MKTLDIISLSTGFLYIISFVLYAITGVLYHLKGAIGLVVTVGLSEFIKKFIIKDISPRPKGALDCNLLCNDGNQTGKPGMPSSHTAAVSFFTVYYLNYSENSIINIFLVIYSILVALSRYLKRCHTIYQIVGGALFGGLSALIVVRYL